ncbi:helix-turn-helix transcriptional regulator [Sporosarcina saromensis]|uniref:Helix-turn-helix transcriptional regulator n=1 Tax=Sporosarcina saromensis TaxID=359365 RepID=A0ABU4G9C0_9BACL|nr:helix-turn-helix transcriptional regulator [Sporosarcina saromensis]MDW0112177.1 helix-turn-helix transcriptional regulator [Sporosarcina saromensis]
MSKGVRELSIEDVVLIKRHLLFKDLKQKEIAFKFGVAPSVISKIKNGQRYKDVKIDENGNLIQQEEGILPEHFHIPSIEKEEKREKPIDDGTTSYRVEFIENYFKRTPKPNPYDEDATYIHYEAKSPKSKRFIGAIYNSRKGFFNNEWNDFISQIMFIVTKAVMTYIPVEREFDWSKVRTNGTKEYLTLNSYINKAIKHEIQEYANQINDTIKIERDGVKGWSSPSMSSLSKKASEEDGSATLGDSVTDSYWKMKKGYSRSHFLDFYTKNYERLLTKEQIKHLNVMKYYQHDRDDSYTIPYSQIPDKPYSQQSVEHNRRRIRKRIEDEYEKAPRVTLRQMAYEKEYEFWSGFMELIWIEDDRVYDQNRLMTLWLKQRKSYQYIDPLLWELTPEHVLSFKNSGSEMDSKTLYLISTYVENRMSELEQLINKWKKVVPLPIARVEEKIELDEEETAKFVSTPTGIYLIKGDRTN